ncbi:hypothetical protein [Bacillus sp. FJAT-45350]|nr:hypothetical protein [Bacillus sp. FJAT-45350]
MKQSEKKKKNRRELLKELLKKNLKNWNPSPKRQPTASRRTTA